MQHSKNIIHRDLKADNIFFSSPGVVKLGDFGFGTSAAPTQMLTTFCGSIQYAAPELLTGESCYVGGYVDIWALACCSTVLYGDGRHAVQCGHGHSEDHQAENPEGTPARMRCPTLCRRMCVADRPYPEADAQRASDDVADSAERVVRRTRVPARVWRAEFARGRGGARDAPHGHSGRGHRTVPIFAIP